MTRDSAESGTCTNKLCGREAEWAYRFGDGFSLARDPETPGLEDGDLCPHVCDGCKGRMSESPHWDGDRWARPEETLIMLAADGGRQEQYSGGNHE